MIGGTPRDLAELRAVGHEHKKSKAKPFRQGWKLR
jgi:hypothetical protein